MAASSEESRAGAVDDRDFDVTRLFGQAVRPWGVPVFIGIVGAGVLAWIAGTSGLLLLVLVAGVGGVLLITDLLRRRLAGELRALPTWVIVTPLVVADLVAASFAIAFRGIDGGMWFAVLMISTVAGQSLPKLPALLMGAFGALVIPTVAIVSGEFDIDHLPVIFAATIYTFAMAGIANSQRSAAVSITQAANDARISVLEAHSSEIGALVNSLTEGLLTTDRNGSVRLWNPAMESITGVSAVLAVGAPATEILKLADASGLLEGSRHPCAPDGHEPKLVGTALGATENEIFVESTDGGRLPVTVSIAPLPVVAGGIVAVVADVSRERQASEMRDSLISIVSHELRTPLAMTLGYADLLVEGAVTGDEAHRSAVAVRDSALRLAALIEDLLSTAAIEAGHLKISKTDVAIVEVVNDALVSLDSDSKARVDVNVDSAIRVNADRARLAQVVSNLLTNGLKYSAETKHVEVSCVEVSGGVELRIRDYGAGIAKDEIPHLFEKFTRVGHEGGADVAGTGLGLFITKAIIDAHEGSVRVESEPGAGTTFLVGLSGQ